MCHTSLESLYIQLAKSGLIWTFYLSNSQKFKVVYILLGYSKKMKVMQSKTLGVEKL